MKIILNLFDYKFKFFENIYNIYIIYNIYNIYNIYYNKFKCIQINLK
jgi:hypothetical protein